jgi:ion channel
MIFTGITVAFLKQFGFALWETFPLLLSLGLAIALLGYTVGRTEGWSSFDSLYWSFITATTVGYGDIKPVRTESRIVAIVIAFLGLMLTGIVIALAVYAATSALKAAAR